VDYVESGRGANVCVCVGILLMFLTVLCNSLKSGNSHDMHVELRESVCSLSDVN